MNVDPLLAAILDAAGRAPSAHNAQPWLLEPIDNGLVVRVRPERKLPAVDPSGADTLHSIGAMLENVLLTLRHLNYDVDYTVPAEGSWPAVRLNWQSKASSPGSEGGVENEHSVLMRMIPVRRTSRLPYLKQSVPPEVLAEMCATVSEPCALHFVTRQSDLQQIRKLAADGTAEQLRDPAVAEELFRWTRFFRRDERWFRDGLNADCMGWRGWEAAAARWILSPGVLALLVRLGLHRNLCASVDQVCPEAPAIGLLTVADTSVTARLEAGRNLQRAWLVAASHSLVTHPVSAAVDVDRTRRELMQVFQLPSETKHVNLFRLGRSAPCARSPRLPADEILATARTR